MRELLVEIVDSTILVKTSFKIVFVIFFQEHVMSYFFQKLANYCRLLNKFDCGKILELGRDAGFEQDLMHAQCCSPF